MNSAAQYSFELLRKELGLHAVKTSHRANTISFQHASRTISFQLGTEQDGSPVKAELDLLPLDYLMKEPHKIAALVLSRLGLNKRVFARSCELRKIDKQSAVTFLNTHHLMYSTQSAYNWALFYKGELLCLASFSKGRKMRRLPEPLRSFELIRFCCKTGVTVTGGLSRLVKNFALERKAGDIMTYVDKQLSEGAAFTRSGFIKVEETPPAYFLVNRQSFEKTLLRDPNAPFDQLKFYRSRNLGNIKFVYTPNA